MNLDNLIKKVLKEEVKPTISEGLQYHLRN